MQKKQIHWGKVILAGVLATVIGFVLEGLLYSASNGVYASYGDLPYAKPVESLPAYLATMMGGSVILTVLFALIYALIRDGLPGQRAWQKGLSFGLILLAVYMLPTAFNTWMQIAQPLTLILLEAVNRTIGLLVQAVIIALVYGMGSAISSAGQGLPAS